MVPLAQTIIENSRIARNAVRQTYSHVFLDEFQDCTADQYALITACFGGSKCLLTAVGDTKQSIMGWAGAFEGIFQTFADDFAAHPLNLYQNFRSAPTLRRMQNAMVRVMDPPAALDDADIVGDEGAIAILNFADDEEEADDIAARVQQLADNDGVSLSEIAVLVSKQQQLYCQKLIAAFGARGIAYREEGATQNLASEPAARLIVDFLLVTSSPRQPAAHRRLLDLVVFNQGVDEEREYQLRSKWNRLLGETRTAIANGKIDLSHKPDLEKLVDTLLDAVGAEAHHSDVLGICARRHAGDLHRRNRGSRARVAGRRSKSATALSSFSGDRAVRIMSIHKSKGLEFDTVFILGVEEDTFWGKQADERSAFCVGISRAKLRLFLTVCEERSRPAGAGRWTVARRPHEEFLSYV
jgi:superfamily I DNA/RNA helicase